MPQSIKLSTDQMRLMSLFQNVTKATARDCVEDETQDKIIFVVQEGKMGLAIGKGGSNIKSLKNIIKRNVELIEYFDDPIKFFRDFILEPPLPMARPILPSCTTKIILSCVSSSTQSRAVAFVTF